MLLVVVVAHVLLLLIVMVLVVLVEARWGEAAPLVGGGVGGLGHVHAFVGW